MEVGNNEQLRAPSTSGRIARIIVADDDRELRRMLASRLRDDGYQVEQVGTGFELLARLSRPPPSGEYDLIISDVRMPGLSGLEVLAVQHSPRRVHAWHTPVILISAFSDDDTYDAADRLGAVLFDKPFDLDDFHTCVINMLSPLGSESSGARRIRWRPSDHR